MCVVPFAIKQHACAVMALMGVVATSSGAILGSAELCPMLSCRAHKLKKLCNHWILPMVAAWKSQI
eukprot:5546138-Amphidinium_carterae.1